MLEPIALKFVKVGCIREMNLSHTFSASLVRIDKTRGSINGCTLHKKTQLLCDHSVLNVV